MSAGYRFAFELTYGNKPSAVVIRKIRLPHADSYARANPFASFANGSDHKDEDDHGMETMVHQTFRSLSLLDLY